VAWVICVVGVQRSSITSRSERTRGTRHRSAEYHDLLVQQGLCGKVERHRQAEAVLTCSDLRNTAGRGRAERRVPTRVEEAKNRAAALLASRAE